MKEPTQNETRDPRRCKARSSRTGEPCQRWAIKGGSVCPSHGGRAPQVMRTARQRLDALVEPVLAGLEEAVKAARASKDPGALDRLARTVLDRCGYPAVKDVRVEDTREPAPWIRYATREELSTLSAIMAAAEARMVEKPAEQAPVVH